ncbi:MAG: T9SS type A sorting domain-containing protein [Bacteroidota bacterium]
MLTQSGLMIGVANDSVIDCLSDQSNFSLQIPATKISSPQTADYEIISEFDDSMAGANKIGIQVEQNVYAWNQLELKDFVIVEYQLTNLNSHHLDNLYLGLYMDYDLNNLVLNTVEYDQSNRLMIEKSNDGSNLWAGAKLLSDNNDNCYAFDFFSGGLGGIDVTDGFTKTEKFTALSSSRFTAGFDTINDVAGLISAGPFTVQSGESFKVSFALLAGINYQNFYNAAFSAQNIYDSLFKSIDKIPDFSNNVIIYPNPVDNYLNIEFYSDKSEIIYVELFDSNGEKVKIYNYRSANGINHIKINISDLPKGTYLLKKGNLYRKIVIS